MLRVCCSEVTESPSPEYQISWTWIDCEKRRPDSSCVTLIGNNLLFIFAILLRSSLDCVALAVENSLHSHVAGWNNCSEITRNRSWHIWQHWTGQRGRERGENAMVLLLTMTMLAVANAFLIRMIERQSSDAVPPADVEIPRRNCPHFGPISIAVPSRR